MTLLELFQLLKKHLKLVIALPVVCAIAMGVVSFTMMDNTYTATTSMYILAKTDGSQTSYYELLQRPVGEPDALQRYRDAAR